MILKEATNVLPNMSPVIVEHGELKLIGIPCVSLHDMGSKYRNAKESLLSSTPYLPGIVNPQIHYGMWPQVPGQDRPETHAYILCVEVESFDGIPEWYIKLTVPPQQCVVVASESGDFDAAGEMIDTYLRENSLSVGAGDRKFTICERYNYEGEGFARYSLPLL